MKLPIAALALVLASTALAAADRLPTIRIPYAPPPEAAEVSRILYLNRCSTPCVIRPGSEDARAHTSNIPDGPGPWTISSWSYGDAAWNELVKCVREVYSPYDVLVTDQKPVDVSYNEAIVAGTPNEIGRAGIGGVAPGTCEPTNNTINFTFSGVYGGDVIEICSTVAQESGHAYGLDHAYEYLDGRSACTDPMTYRTDCGGQRFFRNDRAFCGEYSRESCSCGDSSQNSHLTLLNALGPGTPITTPPTIMYVSPPPNTVFPDNRTPFIVTAGAQRGIKRVELWVNNYKWSEVPGTAFGRNGQPTVSYTLAIPDEVPDGIMDVKIVAKDDIDVATETTVTVTKVAPCADASTCADGQRCEAGKCFWDPPVGEFGDDCTFTQYCTTGICSGTTDKKICTVACVPGSQDSCEAGYDCLETGPGNAICFPADDEKTCCSAASGSSPLQLGLLAFGIVLVLRRRR